MSTSVIPAVPLSLWQQIISSPEDLIGLGTVLVNIGIACWNYTASRDNIKTDRAHKIDFTFYDLMVLHALKELIHFSSDGSKIFIDLKEKVNVSTSGRNLLKLAENAIDSVQKKQLDLEIETVPLLKAFSPALGEEILNLLENFNDESTVVFSKFAHTKPDLVVITSLNNRFSKSQERYGQELMMAVKKHCPKTN